jgi:hypothetical protein
MIEPEWNVPIQEEDSFKLGLLKKEDIENTGEEESFKNDEMDRD